MPTIRQSIIASITRLYPFYSGCGTIANHSLVQFLAGKSTDLAWVRVHGGNFVPALLNDDIGKSIYYSKDLDRKITWICSRIIRHGDTVLDIGANCGLVTFIMSSLVGKTGQVFSFEPIPKLNKLIEKAIIKNNTSNISFFPIALGSQEGELELYMPNHNSGLSSFVRNSENENAVKIKVPVKTLSSLLFEKKVNKIRLVKIDVEGFEPDVLAGANNFFSKHPPETILFELNEYNHAIQEHPTIKILDKLGYDFFSIPKCFFKMKLNKFDLNKSNNPPHGHDFLAVLRGKGYEEVAGLLLY